MLLFSVANSVGGRAIRSRLVCSLKRYQVVGQIRLFQPGVRREGNGTEAVHDEQIIGLLREAEVRLGQGLAIGTICRGLGISEQSYYRWRREYGGLKLDQANDYPTAARGDYVFACMQTNGQDRITLEKCSCS